MSNPRRQARRELGAAAVLSEAEAVALLPCRDATAREWLRERGIVQVTPLGRIVIWGDVLAELRNGGGPVDPEPKPQPRGTLPRVRINRR